MKKYSLLPVALLFLVSHSAWADESDSKDQGQQNVPHAFDAGWKGQKTCEVVFEDQTMLVGRCVFPPGVGHEKHFHNPHFGYVLEGGIMLIQDDQGEHETPVETGSTWSTTGRTIHQGLNIGDTTTRFLMVEPKSPSITVE